MPLHYYLTLEYLLGMFCHFWHNTLWKLYFVRFPMLVISLTLCWVMFLITRAAWPPAGGWCRPAAGTGRPGSARARRRSALGRPSGTSTRGRTSCPRRPARRRARGGSRSCPGTGRWWSPPAWSRMTQCRHPWSLPGSHPCHSPSSGSCILEYHNINDLFLRKPKP